MAQALGGDGRYPTLIQGLKVRLCRGDGAVFTVRSVMRWMKEPRGLRADATNS